MEDNDPERSPDDMDDAADHAEDSRTTGMSPHGGQLSPAEELMQAIGAGRAVRRADNETAARGHSWGDDRQLPAALLYELLVRLESKIKPRAAVLVGLRITGPLNLEGAELQAPLIAHNCYFDAPVNLMAAKASEISLTACRVPGGLAADRLETLGNLDLSEAILAVVGLDGAHIGDRLILSGAQLTGGSDPLDHGMEMLRPPGSPRKSYGGRALIGDNLQVDHDMLCDGCTAKGEVRLSGAHIGGQLSFDRCTAKGWVLLSGAQIGGQLSFEGATLNTSLIAEGLRVDGSMLCGKGLSAEGFTAKGEVRLLDARIGGNLVFDGATLNDDLIANGLRVDGNMLCRNGLNVEGEGFTAKSEVRLSDAHIGGGLSFDGATLNRGLSADRLRVDSAMFCRERFTAKGEVRLAGAHIGGQLSFDGATLTNSDLALNLLGARVDAELFLRFDVSPTGGVKLTGARLGGLVDSADTWPTRLALRDCAYGGLVDASQQRLLQRAEGDIEAAEDATQQREPRQSGLHGRRAASPRLLSPGGPPDVRRRLRWIRLAEEGDGYAPSPYTQLMAFYRREGRDGDARRVAYERERRRRGELGLAGRAWNVFLQWTVGYGYKPLRAVAVIAVLVVVGSLLFSSFHGEGQLSATENDHPPFVASIYTLDRLIPVVSFGLDDAFTPSGAAQWWGFAYTLAGWVLTVAVLAGLNAAVRRD